MRVLLLSAYDAYSHAYWREGLLAMFPDWQWSVLTLPPRHFSWRVRGNPLYWSVAETQTLAAQYDLVIGTSMVDLATLRGLSPALARWPTALYFHENQFAYPQGSKRHGLLEAQMVSIYAAMAADQLLFNSRYNLDTFLTGCADLFARLPDKVPPGLVAGFAAKAEVLPVPLLQRQPEGSGTGWPLSHTVATERALRLLWVGRFEHDKGGDRLLRILDQLEATDVNYELAVIGQQFRNSPAVFSEIEQRFAHRLVQFGFLERRADYHQYLADADVVLSTALHEFQGLAVLEAVAAGCIPLVPDRLVYPEFFAAQYRYPSLDSDDEAIAVAERLRHLAHDRAASAPDVMTLFNLQTLRCDYQAVLQRLAGVVP